MSRTLLAGMLGLCLVACSSAAAREPEHREADRRPPGFRALDRTLAVGTLIAATIDNKPGETLTATVSADVRNRRRWVVIPAGSPVGLRVVHWGPATGERRANARITLEVTSVTVSGQVYPVSATVDLTPVAVRRTSRDGVVIKSGTRILFVLREGLTVERRREEAYAGPATVSPASK